MPIGPRARVDPNEVSAPLGATCNRQSFQGISCARMTNLPGVLLLVSVLAVAGCKGTASSQAMNGVVDEQGYFFVGGRYTQTKDGQIMAGQMFVQWTHQQTLALSSASKFALTLPSSIRISSARRTGPRAARMAAR